MSTTEPKAWAIKLGSAGICVPFCEKHGIVGVGWSTVDSKVLASADRDELWAHVAEVCDWYEGDSRKIGSAAAQLYKFAQVCSVGDIVVYYDPPSKHVRICRVVSEILSRDFEPDVDIDIWHFRKVEYLGSPVPIVDFYGPLKGSVLGPRMSFWSLGDSAAALDLVARGEQPALHEAPDDDLTAAYERLAQLICVRAQSLDASGWEMLVADYFKAQGAHVDALQVGGNQAVIDLEARLFHGELGDTVWRVQVKRYQDQAVDWPLIEKDWKHAGDAEFCFVSVFGFTPEARRKADDVGVRLLEATDFTNFLLSGRVRPELRQKLRLPFG